MEDLLSIYEKHGFSVRQKNSKEFCGPCPWCGGKDRFTLFTDQGREGRGRFWCRQCGASGDVIQLLRDLDGMGYKEALLELGLEQTTTRRKAPARERMKSLEVREFSPAPVTTPPLVWQKAAGEIVTQAAQNLMNSRERLSWLERERGLSDSAAWLFRLGWIDSDIYRSRPSFGLDAETRSDGKPRKVWIPRGLCIPVFSEGGELMRVKIRLADREKNGADLPKYIPIPQQSKSTEPLYSPYIDDKKPYLIVESELDCILLYQKAGKLVNIVAMGSASYRPNELLFRRLKDSKRIICSLDYDDAGSKAMVQWWKINFRDNIKIYPVPFGKDPTDAYRMGLNLSEWVQGAL